MKRTLYLTSVIALGVISSGYSETFPSDGSMQENMTYENAATYQNMGVYEGSVTATAEYDDILYQIMAGKYLPAGSETAISCTSGNYCGGLTNATYNETQNQGLTSCPSSHPNSMAGASSDTQCYTSCTLQGANIAHATSVSGNDYYGTGTDTCSAAACENGYHKFEIYKANVSSPLYGVSADGIRIVASIYGDGTLSDSDMVEKYGLTKPNTIAIEFDNGVVYGHTSCQSVDTPNYLNLIQQYAGGEITADEFKATLEPSVGKEAAELFMNTLKAGNEGLIETGDEDIIYLLHYLQSNTDTSGFSTTGVGQNCYVQFNGFTPIAEFENGVTQPLQFVDSADWRLVSGDFTSAEECLSDCMRSISGILAFAPEMGVPLFIEKFDGTPVAICDANEINITWQDADQADIDANNAGMCTYDGEIRTPVKAATKPGKTFKGWRFEKK